MKTSPQRRNGTNGADNGTEAVGVSPYCIPPKIDYSQHPAFSRPAKRPKHYSETSIDNAIQAIDTSFYSACDTLHATDKSVLKCLSETVETRIDELATMVLGAMHDEKSLLWLTRVLDATKQTWREECLHLNRRHHYRPSEKARRYEKRVQDLHDSGFAGFPFPAKLRASLVESCTPYMQQLRDMAAADLGARVAISTPLHGLLGRTIRRVVNEHGVIAAASEYRRCPMDLLYCSLDYAHPAQVWYRGCYDDVGLGTSKTVTMHYDYESTMMKAMIYLNPVQSENGAFGIIPGSHRWQRSPFLFNLYKELDHQYARLFGQSHKGHYYRPRFHSPEERARFRDLPDRMQGTSHFGDDVLDSTELSDYLLAREVRHLGDEPVCLLFDGPQCIHRGALAVKGERWAIQLGFREREQVAPVIRAYRRARWVAGRIVRGQNPF